jgi:Subtilase family
MVHSLKIGPCPTAALCTAASLALTSVAQAQDQSILLRLNDRDLGLNATEYLADVTELQEIEVRKEEKLGDVIERHCGRKDSQYLELLKKRAAEYPMLSEPLTFETAFSEDAKLKIPFCLALPKVDSSLKTRIGDQWKIGGGSTWGFYSYDPDANPFYSGIGNSSTWNPAQRAGPDADGKLNKKWKMEVFPRDTDTRSTFPNYHITPFDEWDYDGINESIRIPEKTGERLAERYDPVSNWSTGVELDKSKPSYGRPSFVPSPGSPTVVPTPPTNRLSDSAADKYEGWASVPLKPGIDAATALKKVMAKLEPPAAPAKNRPSVASDTLPVTRRPAGVLGLSDIDILETLSADEDKCPNVEMQASKYPFDSLALVRVLATNRARGAIWTEPAEILVADTGLSEAMANRIRFIASAGSESLAQRKPTKDYPKRHHGAYAATAALGGTYFLRYLDLMDHPLRLRPVNIVSDGSGHVKSENLVRVIDAGRYTSAIINLSISYDKEIDGLETVLRDQRNALFVVAAGNKPEPVTNKHPASLGGAFDNLVVVGALDQKGKYSKKSSWSSVHVEIAASGCRIPVLEDSLGGAKPVNKSGTSVAAPLVAFTAAMLHGYRMRGPYDIKMRILASADYDPTLEGKVKHSLRLNVVRALTLRNDVIELNSPGSEPIIGRIVEGDRLLKLCGGWKSKGRKLEHGGLLSLDVFDDKRGAKHIFYSFRDETRRRWHGDTCPLDPDLEKHTLKIEEIDKRTPQTVKVRDIKKLLFAYEH